MQQQSARAYLAKQVPKLRYISTIPTPVFTADERQRTPDNVPVKLIDTTIPLQ
jgi:hypothetical protein